MFNVSCRYSTPVKQQIIDHNCSSRITCPMCKKAYIRRTSLTRHIQEVHNSTGYQCDQCHNFFSSKRTLSTHFRTVHGDRRHVCEACGKQFNRVDSLKRHYKTHSKWLFYMYTYPEIKATKLVIKINFNNTIVCS